MKPKKAVPGAATKIQPNSASKAYNANLRPAHCTIELYEKAPHARKTLKEENSAMHSGSSSQQNNSASSQSSVSSQTKQNVKTFPCYQDSQVVVGSDRQQMMEDNLIPVKQDDDVDTDEDIYEAALKQCSYDFSQTRDLVEKEKMNLILNNYDIKRRVQFPEFYDRAGKWCFPDCSAEAQQRIHPSLQNSVGEFQVQFPNSHQVSRKF